MRPARADATIVSVMIRLLLSVLSRTSGVAPRFFANHFVKTRMSAKMLPPGREGLGQFPCVKKGEDGRRRCRAPINHESNRLFSPPLGAGKKIKRRGGAVQALEKAQNGQANPSRS